ncbi:hypothetical protein D4764_0023290, partial [Takifugu flavidus]
LELLDSIEKLDLSWNQLLWVGSGVFRGLSRLRQLYLHNRLSVVQQGSLDLLPGLEVLNLSNNNISWIDGEALAPLYSLAILALEGNNLHHLKFKTFLSLHTTATHITLSANPWNCDCELHRVFSKILYVRHLHVRIRIRNRIRFIFAIVYVVPVLHKLGICLGVTLQHST